MDKGAAAIDVEISRVVKQFGDMRAVDDVSLTVGRGEFLSLLGPSGCGKTTILRMIAGFEDPSSGSIHIRGRLINGVAPYHRQLGMVFQSYALFPHLTVTQNIAFGLQMQRVPRAEIGRRVADAIGRVGLSGKGERLPRQLSGGEQQRVALARAIVTQPTVLLLDEPFSALDRKLRVQMQVELKQLQRDLGVTTIFVTHDQEEALTMSDRIAVMSRGRIEQLATPGELYARPQSRFVADFIGTSNILVGQVCQVTSSGYSIRTSDGLLFEARSTGQLQEGDRVEVILRPEQIHIGDGATDHLVRGRIVRSAFLGAATLYWVRCGEETELMVLRQNQSSSGLPDAEVTLTWDSESALVMPLLR